MVKNTLYYKGLLIPKAKSGIHIKKQNRGKFRAAALRAGMSVQLYASHVLSNPNAPAYLKKRANFARNAAKWKHQEGGSLKRYLPRTIDDIINDVNNSNAEFVLRLKGNNKEHTNNIDGSISTHKMASSDNIVFPMVQKVNGTLIDFEKPPYIRKAGYENALKTGNYVELLNPQEANWFARNYKQYFKSFSTH